MNCNVRLAFLLMHLFVDIPLLQGIVGKIVTVQEHPTESTLEVCARSLRLSIYLSARSGLIHIGITIVHRPDCTDMEHS